jgi:hypothetical protein
MAFPWRLILRLPPEPPGATDFQTRLSLGTCLLEIGRQDEGLAALRVAIQLAPQSYPAALKILVTSGRGRFWLRPSAAAGLLRPAGR